MSVTLTNEEALYVAYVIGSGYNEQGNMFPVIPWDKVTEAAGFPLPKWSDFENPDDFYLAESKVADDMDEWVDNLRIKLRNAPKSHSLQRVDKETMWAAIQACSSPEAP